MCARAAAALLGFLVLISGVSSARPRSICEGSFYAERPSFSHGCIRIEKPAALAQYVLRHKSYWTGERIRAAMSSGRERSVTLTVPLPVHIVYWTAWVEEDGAVNFRDDVYGYDKAQQRLLQEETRGRRAVPGQVQPQAGEQAPRRRSAVVEEAELPPHQAAR